MITGLPPLSLYIHIPWCVRKCPYCDFNSHEKKAELPEQAYVDTLIEDLEQDLALARQRPLGSIFFGGGTPSLFSAGAIARILDAVQARMTLADDIEITLEANPGTAEQLRFTGYREAGVNRLSIGIQSFDDRQLQKLGRIHSSAEAERAINLARQSGFDNVNIDIMYALGEQGVEQAMRDLQGAISCEPEHLSWYQLTIEPNTAFYKRRPVLPGEDTMAAIQQAGFDALAGAGYQHYEVSAFARAGRQARHNLNYWRFGDYLGIGAGAHGKITLPDKQQIVRTRKSRQPEHYMAASLSRNTLRKVIAQEDLSLEFMLNTLRLHEGFTTSQFETLTGLPFGQIQKQVESLVSRGLLHRDRVQRDQDHFRPTEKGRQFHNTLLETFL